MMDIPGQPGMGMGALNLGDIFGKAFGGRRVRRRMTVAPSYELLITEEADKLLDSEAVTREAIHAVEQNGIVFIDEIDKVCARAETRGADVSREGVQRDLLPLIEGTTVSTKHGPVQTDHVLFIASGAFHIAKPSDLLPELQGRLPIRVELRALTEADFVRILTETDNALTRQYSALMATENVGVDFTPDGIAALARIAAEVNRVGREHRRPAAAHRARAGVRGPELHRPGPRRRPGDGRRRLRRDPSRRAQPLGRPQPLRALRRSVQASAGRRRQCISAGTRCGRATASTTSVTLPDATVDREPDQEAPAGRNRGPGRHEGADAQPPNRHTTKRRFKRGSSCRHWRGGLLTNRK